MNMNTQATGPNFEMTAPNFAGAGASLRVAVLRSGREQWVAIPVQEVPRAARMTRLATASLIAGALLAIPLFLLWRSASRAGVPLALFYSAVAVVAVTVISGRSSEWLTRAALLAMIVAPAILAHLSLTFPRERWVIRQTPELLAIPYALGALLVPIGWFALERNPLLWPSFASTSRTGKTRPGRISSSSGSTERRRAVSRRIPPTSRPPISSL